MNVIQGCGWNPHVVKGGSKFGSVDETLQRSHWNESNWVKFLFSSCMSVINILVKHFKPNYSTHSLTSSKRRRISWVVWLDIPFNCLFPVSVSSLSAITCTSLLCSCDWNVPEGVFNLAPTKNFTWTNTTTLYISLLRFWITWKLLFLIITHRLISTRSYLTKHVTWYKIAQRLSGDNSRPLQYPLNEFSSDIPAAWNGFFTKWSSTC